MKALLALALVGLLTACATGNRNIPQKLTSGAIGCPADEVTITNDQGNSLTSVHTWEASCRDEKFVCNYHGTTGINCTKAITRRSL